MAHLKFLKHGTGSARHAVRYLIGHKEGRTATVLRGDPDQVALVADSLTTRYRYTSAVINFAPEDAPSPEEIDHCLDDFCRAMGLDADRLAWTAILHHEPGDRVALHILVARVDLVTGKSYNPAPPGWQKRYDPLRDAWNYENGWARPDDPERARLLQPGDQAFIDAENLRKGVAESDDPKKLITEYLIQRVEAGVVNDRAGVIRSLEEAGFEINRLGQDYLSIRDKESGQKFRMKGVLYDANFTPEKLERSGDSPEEKKGGRSAPDPERGRRYRIEFEKQLRKVCEYNQKRYRIPCDQALDSNLGRNFDRNGPSCQRPRPDPLVSHVRGSADKIGPGNDEDFSGIREKELLGARGIDSNGERTLAGHRQDGGDLVAAAPRSDMGPEPSGERWNELLPNFEEVDHDGNRETLDGRVATLRRNARALGERERAANHALEQSSRGFCDRLENVRCQALRLVESLGRNLGRVKEWAAQKREDEMKRRKKAVNLAEFLGKHGFTKEKDLGKGGLLMTHPGGERLIVTTNGKNHGAYVNVNDDTDEGSVVEFLMRRRAGGIRSVRAELRAWLGRWGPTWGMEEYGRPTPTTTDQQKILLDLARMSPGISASLKSMQKIPEKILADRRFFGTILTDSKGHAIFPHILNGVIVGYESDPGDDSGVSITGEKGLWLSHGVGRGSKRITLCRSGVECLAHAPLHPTPESDYISLAGTLSESQRSDLEAIARMAGIKGIEIVVAEPNDPHGNALAEVIKEIFRKNGIKTLREIPERGNDWSDTLRRFPEAPSPPVKRPWLPDLRLG